MTLAQYVDQQGQSVRLGKELGRGGQGAVYEVSGQTEVVAKIYLKQPDAESVSKLMALAQVSAPQLLDVSAWPQFVLKDSSGRVQGFVMPLVSDTEYHELHNLYRIASRRQVFPQVDIRFLIHVARNVSRAFTVLHTRNLLMGDVSSRNVMVSQNGTVRLIDTDSFQITVGGQTYPCPVGTAEFTAPELQGRSFGTLVRTREHDLFGLALLIFHLLFDGRHPYAGIHDNGAMPSPAEAIKADKFAYSLQYQHGVKPPPFTLTLHGLHSSVRSLFERAFSPKHQNRPQADEWDKMLAEVIRHLTICSKNGAHKHDSRVPCPWCSMLPANAQAATAKTGIPSIAKRIDVDGELNLIWKDIQSIQRPAPPTQLSVTAQGTLSLLAQPTLASAPIPSIPPPTGISASAYGWGALYIVLGLSALIGGSWFGFLLFSALSIYNFSRNSASAIAGRQTKFNLHTSLLEYRQELGQLENKITEAEARQKTNSAQSRYSTAKSNLENLGKAVRDIDRHEREKTIEVIKKYQKSELDQHLLSNVIRPGIIPGVGPTLIVSLNQQGVYTAKDITQDVRWIKGVGPKRQQDLQAWRDTLEQFHQFNPKSIPSREFEIIRDQMDQDRQLKLNELKMSVKKLKDDLVNWKNADDAISRDIQKLRNRLIECQRIILATEESIRSNV